jgi:HEAT repeat protein
MSDVEKLAEVVDEMIVQHDYPGFEPRSLKLGLPDFLVKASARMYAEALGHESIYVKLAALRWFQERPGMMKPYINAVAGLVDNTDPWVRLESIQALERYPFPSPTFANRIAERLQDEDVDVQRASAKALGKIGSKLKLKDGEVIEGLKQAAQGKDGQLRGKAEKALRKIGVYS